MEDYGLDEIEADHSNNIPISDKNNYSIDQRVRLFEKYRKPNVYLENVHFLKRKVQFYFKSTFNDFNSSRNSESKNLILLNNLIIKFKNFDFKIIKCRY